MANLDQLPPIGAMLYVLPMKIEDGTGGAARVLAVKDGYTSRGVAGVQVTHLANILALMVLLISCLV